MNKYRKMAEKLVSEMTLEEKVSQTLYDAPAIPRLGIPAYNWWNESLHGVARAGTATVFPQTIGVAATFDEDLVKKVGETIAQEGRAKYNEAIKHGEHGIYKGLTFWAPNVNIFRDPRWGRGQETFGEDPYLTSQMAVSFINAIQENVDGNIKAAACAKHFAVHSGPEPDRHYFNAEISDEDLYETYLPAFEAAVKKAHVEAVMGAYNAVNGVPSCMNKRLLIDILRNKWHFEGHVVSDCGAIKDLHRGHKVAKTPYESAVFGMNNGCDLNCGGEYSELTKAVKNGDVLEERIDEAVIRLMELRYKLGILGEKNKKLDGIPYSVVDDKEKKELNEEVAAKSLVLLKNDNDFLPISKKQFKSIGVIGPNADSRKALVGNYEGTASRYITVLEGIEDYVGDEVIVRYSQGCHLYKTRKNASLSMATDRIAEARSICEVSDVIVLVLGLDASIEGEAGDAGNDFASGDKPDLFFPGMQTELLEVVCSYGKPVVLISMSGSAMDLRYASEHCNAIIQAWYPGARGGKAIADILFGECCPEGKLPVTIYNKVQDLPDFKDYSMKSRTYRFMSKLPLYPFGYGMSYNKYELKNVELNALKIEENRKISFSADLRNLGEYNSAETIQVYVKAPDSYVPNPQLRALYKIRCLAKECKHLELEISPETFYVYDKNGNQILNKGTYTIYIGLNQPDDRSYELTGNRIYKFSIDSE
ncbi:MAG: glycoside hydrolase family 3 C-terminal domain-containing protein [Butyrivibrio sp.]|nr:glycoside hydrolase family 3 C-terminal domain-containing protein [Butyrivibrio sp.]